jgi:hypothetical protein
MYPSLIDDIRDILARDLNVLAEEISNMPEGHLWVSVPGVTNSSGTLALHLCGNLRHFIGAVLGKDGYLRNRDAEFSRKDMSKAALIAEIRETRSAIIYALEKLEVDALNSPMPDTPPHHRGRSIGFFLIQLCCHFSRHEGQLNYLRRILAAEQP